MTFLLYGANGYTGRLVARLAVERGLRPVLAGRSADPVAAVAGELGLESRVFALDRAGEVAARLRGFAGILHCAGPFQRTAQVMAAACIQSGVHYLDVTGEVPVFELLQRFSTEARDAGVMLLPGAGFDVVPSDCLAAHLKRRMPAARRLTLAFAASGRMSHGTATTVVESLHLGGLVRRDGRLTRVPAGWKTREIDYGRGKGPEKSVTIPWGDVSTAYYSTGIPEIEVYTAMPALARAMVRMTRFLARPLASRPIQSFLKGRIDAAAPGPSDAERARGRCWLWGEVEDAEGRRLASRLETPEGYTLTARTSLAIVERVLAGQAPPGFQTPSRAYGPDFVLEIPGVRRSDL